MGSAYNHELHRWRKLKVSPARRFAPALHFERLQGADDVRSAVEYGLTSPLARFILKTCHDFCFQLLSLFP